MKRRTFLKVVGVAAGSAAVVIPSVGAPQASEQKMPRRKLGRTGFEISVIGFSGFALHHKNLDQEACNKIVRDALAGGVNYFDVAPAYGNGSCETRLGEALQGVERKSYYLACKTKMRDKAGAREELERSLKRLKTDYFDVYQMHHLVKPDDVKRALGEGGALETFLEAKKAGQIKAIGFSAHTTKAALEALRGFAFDTVMFPINYVEYFTRDFGREVMALANEKGAAILAIKPMNSGAWPPNTPRTRQWWYKPLENQEDINLAYRWTLSLPGVVSTFSPAWPDLQAKAILAGYALKPCTEADVARLKEMAAGCGSIFKREEDSVAFNRVYHSPYPYYPHECDGGELA